MASEYTTSSDELIEKHYSRLADTYDEFLHYSDNFVRRLTAKMVEALQLRPEDAFVDLGGGTGMYARDILEQVALQQPVLLVEPFAEMLDQAPPDDRVTPLRLDAIAFSQEQRRYDKILIKEAIHHIDDKARLFANLYQRLRPGGALLLVHVPPEIEYPLFRRALERSRTWHANPDELERLLRRAGFEVRRDALRIRHRLPKEVYFRMVEGRYMSLLSSFADDELAAGLAEMAETHAGTGVLEFTDHFDFISARKPGERPLQRGAAAGDAHP